MLRQPESIESAADRLCELYEQEFGGKERGRYRIASKLLKVLVGRRRLYEDDMRDLARAMFERGYVLIEMEGFCVVLSANTFTNYRRVNDDCLERSK